MEIGDKKPDVILNFLQAIYRKTSDVNAKSNLLVKESFDETDLDDDYYEVLFTPSDIIGLGIVNNSTENELVITINEVDIHVPAAGTWRGAFDADDLYLETVGSPPVAGYYIEITGTDLSFDAYLEG